MAEEEKVPQPENEDIASLMTPEEIEDQRIGLGELFDNYPKPEDRAKEIFWRVEAFLDSEIVDGEKMRQGLKELETIEDKEEFIYKVLSIFIPMLVLRKSDPEVYKRISAENRLRNEEKYRERDQKSHEGNVNEILYYDIRGDAMEIHLGHAKKLGFVKNFKRLIIGGFRDLAKIINENKNIKEVVGISLIVTEHPELMEKAGFTVTNEINENGATKAVISREEFLKKYLEKE